MFWTILELISVIINLGITLLFLFVLIIWRHGWAVLLEKSFRLAKVYHDIEVIKRKFNVSEAKNDK